jgi:hypothetical protein
VTREKSRATVMGFSFFPGFDFRKRKESEKVKEGKSEYVCAFEKEWGMRNETKQGIHRRKDQMVDAGSGCVGSVRSEIRGFGVNGGL